MSARAADSIREKNDGVGVLVTVGFDVVSNNVLLVATLSRSLIMKYVPS